MKSTKSKSSKQVSKAAAPIPTSSTDFGTRLSRSRGRIVGVTTVSGNSVRKVNGQVRSVTPNFVTVYDRNKKKEIKFARTSILSVSGV